MPPSQSTPSRVTFFSPHPRQKTILFGGVSLRLTVSSIIVPLTRSDALRPLDENAKCRKNRGQVPSLLLLTKLIRLRRSCSLREGPTAKLNAEGLPNRMSALRSCPWACCETFRYQVQCCVTPPLLHTSKLIGPPEILLCSRRDTRIGQRWVGRDCTVRPLGTELRDYELTTPVFQSSQEVHQDSYS